MYFSHEAGDTVILKNIDKFDGIDHNFTKEQYFSMCQSARTHQRWQVIGRHNERLIIECCDNANIQRSVYIYNVIPTKDAIVELIKQYGMSCT